MFDGEVVHKNSTIIINDGVIQKIFTNQNTSFSGENVMEGKGSTVIPGLINAHVHIDSIEKGKEAVKAGILTVLDMARLTVTSNPSIHELKKLGDSLSYLPYFYTAGNPVTVPDGHGTQILPYKTVSMVDELPQFIEQRVNEGSDFIKIMIERGGPRNRRPNLSDEMIRESIRLAKVYDLMSVAHISERSFAIKATEMGIDGLVHFWIEDFWWHDDPTIEGDTSRISQEELDILINSQVFIIPTISVWKELGDKFGPFDLKSMKEEIGRVHKAGIPILAGTDAPSFNINFGTDLHTELRYLSECGISDLEVLKSATSNISKAFKLGSKGFIKEGCSADLLLIDGDPTEDISTIGSMTGVWKKGIKIEQ
jgi:cytosine/adenosine deaminase-related metal-dependent hydrolase